MQIAAMNPIAINSDQVDQSVVDKEIEIGKDQARKEGKPEQITKVENSHTGKFLTPLLNGKFKKTA